jgi:hypothetical protein
MMKRNLVYVRTGDNSLHPSWAVPRSKRNYDLFISYFGSSPGTFEKDGEYYEVATGLKLPAFTKLIEERPALVYSYDAIWIPDDDLLTSAEQISRMFDLFHKHKLYLAQPALFPGSYAAHPVTSIVKGKSLHFSRYVEVMCPIFSRFALKKLARTFSLTASSWGIDFLWGHRLGYPARRIAILDETPVVHTRPIGKGSFYDAFKGQKIDPQDEKLKLVKKYKIDSEMIRKRAFGSIPASRSSGNKSSGWASLYFLQEMMDRKSKAPIFYENRAEKLKLRNSERPNFSRSPESHLGGTPNRAGGARQTSELKKLMQGSRRLRSIAKDFVEHWVARQKMREGKAMFVCTDSRVCFKLLEIVGRLRPKWKQNGTIAVAVAPLRSSATPGGISKSKSSLIKRFKDPKDSLEIIIVDDFERHEFDCPLLNTLYVDVPKPIEQHHELVQHLMRIFQNRLATLVVDYLGLSDVAFQISEPSAPQKPVVPQISRDIPAKVIRSRRPNRSRRQQLMESAATRGTEESCRLPTSVLKEGQRIAHLFLIRKNLNHERIWKKFFQGYEKYYNIYVHAKEPEAMASDLLQGRHIAQRCETEYGHVSLVKAEILLLQEALENKENKFFLLHSESCVPVRSFEYIYQQLFGTGRSWLFSFKGDMWRYYGIKPSVVPNRFFFKSSQFFCLTRNHAQAVLANGGIEHWEHCNCADEHYFPTALAMRGKLSECLRQPLTFTEWNRKRRESGWGPTTYHKLSPSDLKALRRTDSLFARKFAPDSDIARHIEALHSHATSQ